MEELEVEEAKLEEEEVVLAKVIFIAPIVINMAPYKSFISKEKRYLSFKFQHKRR